MCRKVGTGFPTKNMRPAEVAGPIMTSMLPFGDYRPDFSAYQGASSQMIQNVVPRGDGYGPFADLTAFTSALPAACRGFFYARKTDGSIAVFAGTSTKLYLLSN